MSMTKIVVEWVKKHKILSYVIRGIPHMPKLRDRGHRVHVPTQDRFIPDTMSSQRNVDITKA